MKVRKLDSDGDYSFGHGSADFLQDVPEAVAQDVQTRLALWRGTWFVDLSSGTPWLESILGRHDMYEQVIRERILDTDGVTGIETLDFLLDADTRDMTITAELDTAYGSATIAGEDS